MPSEKYYDIARWEMQQYQDAQKNKVSECVMVCDVMSCDVVSCGVVLCGVV
jgi:hypothetical protein